MLRAAGRPVWQQQLVALTSRLLAGTGEADTDAAAAEVIRALAWTVTSGGEHGERMLGKLASLAVRELIVERERLADVPREQRFLPMDHPDLGTVLVEPEPVHAAHAVTDEIDLLVSKLVQDRYHGLKRGRAPSPWGRADHLGMIVIGAVTRQTPRLRALLPDGRLMSRRAEIVAAVQRVIDNTEPDAPPKETALDIIGDALRAMGVPPRKVTLAIDAVKKRSRRKRARR